MCYKCASIEYAIDYGFWSVRSRTPWSIELDTYRLYQDITRCQLDHPRDRKFGVYFDQRISIAEQCSNAASLLERYLY